MSFENTDTDKNQAQRPSTMTAAAWIRFLAGIVYPLALLGAMVYLFASFGPGWGLVAVLALALLMLFNRPNPTPEE